MRPSWLRKATWSAMLKNLETGCNPPILYTRVKSWKALENDVTSVTWNIPALRVQTFLNIVVVGLGQYGA